MINTGRYYRPDEVAEILNVDKSSIYRMIKDIEDPLPAIKLNGGCLRIPGQELSEWLERRRVNSAEV
jgi:excisionase family DNA binding protein